VIVFNSGWPTDYSLRIKSVQCGRTDAGTGSLKITLNDTASSVLIIPGSAGGGQAAFVFPQPIQVAADTNLTATMSANTISVFCNAQGFLAN
jgi:hypothetical protein